MMKCMHRIVTRHSRRALRFQQGIQTNVESFVSGGYLPANGGNRRNYQVAIVGSGPSGCYTAKYLESALRKAQKPIHLDVLDRLPTPYGLVRYGVAPDHPEVKNVQNDFDDVLSTKCNFWGHVQVGRDISLEDLRQRYDAVVLAYGCEGDRTLPIPGVDKAGVLSAREFVGWYNGHPDYQHVGSIVQQALGSDGEAVRDAQVVVIGHGNVALDCARILAKGRRGLYDTDITSQALDVLGDGVKKVSIVGRRGSVQGAFTIKELRELVNLSKDGHDANFVVSSAELDRGETEASKAELEGPRGRPKTRIHKLLRDSSSKELDPNLSKRVDLRFLMNPIKLEEDSNNAGTIGAVLCEQTVLEGEPGSQAAVGTGVLESIPAQLALVSIGYKGLSIPGLESWFDEASGTVTHENGRVDRGNDTLGGLYTAGWLKRGPSGIIGTNIGDAKDTVTSILEDMQDQKPKQVPANLEELLSASGVDFVKWDGYQRIVENESARRRSEKQPREKLTSVDEMLGASRAREL